MIELTETRKWSICLKIFRYTFGTNLPIFRACKIVNFPYFTKIKPMKRKKKCNQVWGLRFGNWDKFV